MSHPPPGVHVTYTQQFRRCGKAGCATCGEGKPGHGPYWYAYWREGGQVHTHYVGRHRPLQDDAAISHDAAPRQVAADTLRVRTLGAFQVWRGDTAIPATVWQRRKAGALFKCLLAAARHRLHRDQAAELLWPEIDSVAGAAYLRGAIHQVRKILDRPDTSSHLHTDGEWLVLVPAPTGDMADDWLDVAAFARATTMALSGRDIVACRAALACYGGEYLPDDAYSEWAVGRREEVRRQRLTLLVHLAGLCAEQGVAGEAAGYLEEVLREDDCNETAARELMRLHAAAGQRVEAMRVYRRLATALREELSLQPEPETLAVYRSLRHVALPEPPGQPASDGSSTGEARLPPGNVPAPLTSFVGREQAIAEIVALLAGGGPGHRLLTLIGAGGCGKTRLALEVAAALQRRQPAEGTPHPYADGVWLAELAATAASHEADPTPVVRVLMATLGLREEPRQSLLATLTGYLRSRRLLLVLDNCEHLIAACAELAAMLLQACAGLQILATSREALDVPGEIWWRVPSLSCPVPAEVARRGEGEPPAQADSLARDVVLGYEAIHLFVERARARRPGLEPTAAEVAAMAHICYHLDGIPLAIELAAALLPELTVEQIAARLDDRFRLLTRGSRVLRPRHQTLRAAMEWSYALLQEPEQALLRRLSICAGGWSLDVAEAICPGDGVAYDVVAPLLARLVAKSLVIADGAQAAANGPERYSMLETVRHYAREQLGSDEAASTQERHWDWCMALADRAVDAFSGAEQGNWLERLEREHDNLRAALAWSGSAAGTHRDGLRLAAALWRFWYVRGHFSEGRRWLEEFLARQPLEPVSQGGAPGEAAGAAPRDSPRAKALTGAGNLAFIQGDLTRAAALQHECLALYRGYGNTLGIAAALHNLANMLYRQGDLNRAVALLEEALVLQRQLDRKDILSAFLNSLGNALMHQGHYERAATLFAESLALSRELEHTWGCIITLRNLGLVARFQGDYERAASLFEESLALSQQLGSVQDSAVAINDLGQVACAQGAYEQAITLHEESLALARQLGDQWSIASALYGLGHVALKQGRYQQATALFADSLESWHQQGGKEGVIQSLEGLACAQARDGHGVPIDAAGAYAARLYGAAEALRTATSMPLPPAAQHDHRQAVATIRTRLGSGALAAHWAVGAAMTLDDVVAYALSEAPRRQ